MLPLWQLQTDPHSSQYLSSFGREIPIFDRTIFLSAFCMKHHHTISPGIFFNLCSWFLKTSYVGTLSICIDCYWHFFGFTHFNFFQPLIRALINVYLALRILRIDSYKWLCLHALFRSYVRPNNVKKNRLMQIRRSLKREECKKKSWKKKSATMAATQADIKMWITSGNYKWNTICVETLDEV